MKSNIIIAVSVLFLQIVFLVLFFLNQTKESVLAIGQGREIFVCSGQTFFDEIRERIGVPGRFRKIIFNVGVRVGSDTVVDFDVRESEIIFFNKLDFSQETEGVWMFSDGECSEKVDFVLKWEQELNSCELEITHEASWQSLFKERQRITGGEKSIYEIKKQSKVIINK